VAPFTTISAADVRRGRFQPRWRDAGPRVLAYLEALEASGRFTHMVWPIHCEIGTWGHGVHADVRLACNRWEEAHLTNVEMVTKGANPWTEHYSAIRAEVPDPEDDATQSNRAFLDELRQADRVYITGEAGSHCVRATTEHIVAAFAEQGDDLSKLALVTDCMSPVAGFEAPYADFLSQMKARGLSRATSPEVVAELVGRP
jgi:nicotinamidase-related amidase